MDKEGCQEGRACGSRSSTGQDYLLGFPRVRLQLPEDISPGQMAHWELKYQASRVHGEGLQVPEASAAQVLGHKRESGKKKKMELSVAIRLSTGLSWAAPGSPGLALVMPETTTGYFQHNSERPKISPFPLTNFREPGLKVEYSSRQLLWATRAGS